MADFYFPLPNATGVEDLFIYSNTVTNDFFGISILLTLGIIMFISMKTRNISTEAAFATTTFSVTIVSYLLILVPGLISVNIALMMTFLTALAAIWLYKSEGSF